MKRIVKFYFQVPPLALAKKMPSFSILLVLGLSFDNMILFLWFHILQVSATHQINHLCDLIPKCVLQTECCMKFFLGCCEKGPTILIQDKDSHQICLIFVIAKKQMPCILLFFRTEWTECIIYNYISACQVQFSGQSVPP